MIVVSRAVNTYLKLYLGNVILLEEQPFDETQGGEREASHSPPESSEVLNSLIV
jgi:hypothetical protein